MRRGLLHSGAWILATGAAVTVSWFGVHRVLSETAYDPPRTLPITGLAAGESPGGGEPRSSSTHRSRPPSPGPSRTAAPERKAGSGDSTGGRSGARPSGAEGRYAEPSGSRVEDYVTEGGRAVFDLGESSASLVSATPHAGWDMRVWKAPGWIRVTFSSEGRAWTVFCTFNGHPPQVETYRD